jgi:branched-subunit amino acid transport protein
MMQLWAIIGMALSILALRLGGFFLADLPLPATFERALGFMPLAMLTALCVTTLPGHNGDNPTRLAAATGAAFVARVTGRVWACIVGGMVFYWLIGWLVAAH